jgi:hypothetical protein
MISCVFQYSYTDCRVVYPILGRSDFLRSRRDEIVDLSSPLAVLAVSRYWQELEANVAANMAPVSATEGVRQCAQRAILEGDQVSGGLPQGVVVCERCSGESSPVHRGL